MDIVYIYKYGYDNCVELRYSLRSLQNIEHNNVFIIGDKPYWAKNIIHILANDPYTIKALNALNKIKIACNDERISEDFILMNDDFYITEPTDIKYFTQGTIQEHYNRRGQTSQYERMLKNTLDLFPSGQDFSVHCPIIYNKDKFLNVIKEYNMNTGYLLRNLYCNHYGIKGVKIQDNKSKGEYWKEITTFISSCDELPKRKDFKDYMNNLFPNKCKYEGD